MWRCCSRLGVCMPGWRGGRMEVVVAVGRGRGVAS